MEANTVAKGTFKITLTEIIRYLVMASFYILVTRTGALTETDLGVISVLTFLDLLIPRLTSLALPTALTKYVSEHLKRNEKAQAAIVQKTVNTSVLVFSTSGLIITILLSGLVSQYFWKSEIYASLIVLMAIAIYFNSMVQLFGSNLRAFFLFGKVAIVTLLWVVLSRFLGAFLAFINFGVYGVVFAYIAGYATASVAAFLWSRGKVSSPSSYMSLKPLLGFSFPLFLSHVVLIVLNWADIVVLASITSNYATLGIYYLAAQSVGFLSVLYLPLTFTVLPLLSAQHGVKDFQGIDITLKTASRYLNYLMLPACIGLAIMAPTALGFVYGQQYVYGSIPFAILSLAQILVALYLVFTTTLTAIGKTSDVLKINTISVFSYIALLLALVPSFTDVGAASARFGMQVIALAMTIYLLRKSLRVGLDKESLWKSVIASITIVPILILTAHVLESFPLHLTLALEIAAAMSVYLLLLYLLRALGHQDFELLRETFPSLTKYIDVAERIMVRKTRA